MELSCWFPDTKASTCNVGPRPMVSWIFQLEPDGCIVPRWSQWFIRLIAGKARLTNFAGDSACFAEVELAQRGDTVTHVHRLALRRLPVLPSGYIDADRFMQQIRNLLIFRLHFDQDDPGLNEVETRLCEWLAISVRGDSSEEIERDRARVAGDLWAPTAAQIGRLCELVNRRAGQALLTPARFRSEFAGLRM
jgi:hypothetical protein